MLRTTLLIGAVAALCVAAPANASIRVLGAGYATACYENSVRDNHTMEAIEECSVALHRDPLSTRDRASTFVNRGILWLHRGNIDSAMADFDRAVNTDPDLAEGYLNRGTALMRRQDFRAALAAFNEGLQRHPENLARAHYNRGVAHEELGDYRAAYDDYRRAQELEPTWNLPRTELARFRVQ